MAISIDEANLPEKYYNKAFNPTKNLPHWVSEVELEYFEGESKVNSMHTMGCIVSKWF